MVTRPGGAVLDQETEGSKFIQTCLEDEEFATTFQLYPEPGRLIQVPQTQLDSPARRKHPHRKAERAS
ncbi:unnamed protein product [Tetraodon nigroviridis]|uniref:Chromosome undetermined SCAF13964, whole genome shotgun sequence n=1 Tax=Tetraodon nigroviridis TaxID=99883 RepID=Q4SUD6_TETNG|nr:unnamed protein product [Tetraodon nigroviridis]